MKYILVSLVFILISSISLPCFADTGSGVSIPLTVTVTGGGSGPYYGGGTPYVEPVRPLITTEAPQSSATGYIPPAPPIPIPPAIIAPQRSSTPTGAIVDKVGEGFKWGEFGAVIFWAVMAGLTIAVIYYVWRKRRERFY